MDIEKIIEELRAERNRLEGIIVALERLHGTDATAATPKRRGRKFMDKQGRKDVSERMKRYWAARRMSGTGKKDKADGASASGEREEQADRAKSADATLVIAA